MVSNTNCKIMSGITVVCTCLGWWIHSLHIFFRWFDVSNCSWTLHWCTKRNPACCWRLQDYLYPIWLFSHWVYIPRTLFPRLRLSLHCPHLQVLFLCFAMQVQLHYPHSVHSDVTCITISYFPCPEPSRDRGRSKWPRLILDGQAVTKCIFGFSLLSLHLDTSFYKYMDLEETRS